MKLQSDGSFAVFFNNEKTAGVKVFLSLRRAVFFADGEMVERYEFTGDTTVGELSLWINAKFDNLKNN